MDWGDWRLISMFSWIFFLPQKYSLFQVIRWKIPRCPCPSNRDGTEADVQTRQRFENWVENYPTRNATPSSRAISPRSKQQFYHDAYVHIPVSADITRNKKKTCYVVGVQCTKRYLQFNHGKKAWFRVPIEFVAHERRSSSFAAMWSTSKNPINSYCLLYYYNMSMNKQQNRTIKTNLSWGQQR